MIVGVLKETLSTERRVALVPASVEKLSGLGYEVRFEKGAGARSGFADDEYQTAGARVVSRDEALAADIVLQVRGPGSNLEKAQELIGGAKKEQVWIGLQDPLWRPDETKALAERGATVMSLEMIPRISRAQSMDVLSSMATIAGYKAVLLAASELPQMFPMMMTAAGTLKPARVFVLGAGVAGLQAIATARRLGAVVSGYDIRPAAAEQIESLGAKSIQLEIETEGSEDKGGYARAQGEDTQRRQRELLAEVLTEQDVVITTAAVPGAKSPLLVTTEMVEGMPRGSVVIDLAAERGGNCELTKADERVEHGGVLVLGPTDLASTAPRHASQMYSNNLTTLLHHLTDDSRLVLDMSDEITRGTTIAQGGEVLDARVRGKLGLEPLPDPNAETPDSDASRSESDNTEGSSEGPGDSA